MKNYNRIMEMVWLAISIITFIIVCYFVITDGFRASVQYFVFPGLAAVMYAVRLAFRKRMEKNQRENE